jgi:peptide alpha-N-acetyltransferase
MSLSEKKKALRKAKKAELKNADNPSQLADSTAQDPLGTKLLEGDPLANAMKFLSSLLEFSPDSLKVQILGAQIYVRRSNL